MGVVAKRGKRAAEWLIGSQGGRRTNGDNLERGHGSRARTRLAGGGRRGRQGEDAGADADLSHLPLREPLCKAWITLDIMKELIVGGDLLLQ